MSTTPNDKQDGDPAVHSTGLLGHPEITSRDLEIEQVERAIDATDVEIRRIEGDQNEPPSIKPVHSFKTGQKVRFSDENPIIWPPGKIVRLASDGRISVEIYLMGRMVPILVLPHQIEAM